MSSRSVPSAATGAARSATGRSGGARFRWNRVLHDNVAGRLAAALKPLPKTVVTTIPFHLP
jgi:hypothetical protein